MNNQEHLTPGGVLDDREMAARIIEPSAWKKFDRNSVGYAPHVTRAQRLEWHPAVQDSLRKADAILSALRAAAELSSKDEGGEG